MKPRAKATMLTVLLGAAVLAWFATRAPHAGHLVYAKEVHDNERVRAMEVPQREFENARSAEPQARAACKSVAVAEFGIDAESGEGTWSIWGVTMTIRDTLQPPANLSYVCKYDLTTGVATITESTKN